ncbi:hypothetical protein EDE11_12956 [Methylomonas methanica]|uniref:Uncharacterized protein n=1 Tax=Methylomonas methanica TaxID=421 RepID=A0ABY2CH88_METMH|nr:hypothetical protein EDE11_12956 [Methylomonas methanica]
METERERQMYEGFKDIGHNDLFVSLQSKVGWMRCGITCIRSSAILSDLHFGSGHITGCC